VEGGGRKNKRNRKWGGVMNTPEGGLVCSPSRGKGEKVERERRGGLRQMFFLVRE